jgi:hypothetical protein
MIERQDSLRVVVLVKAVPRPSRKYGETVCCAGVTEEGAWKRLYPVRFRQLSDDAQFGRWGIVTFRWRAPTNDSRAESCHVYEDTIKLVGTLPAERRAEFLDRIIVSGASVAVARQESLALIRPRNTHFFARKKTASAIAAEKALFEHAGRQASLLDAELASIEPLPYAFGFRFEDTDGRHIFQCGDWETQATFWKWRKQYGDDETLRRLAAVYNDVYPQRGMVFALGTVLKRPHTWQLLGVIRADTEFQQSLSL